MLAFPYYGTFPVFVPVADGFPSPPCDYQQGQEEDFQLPAEEKSAAEAAAHSPVVGEKRLRDEDDGEQARHEQQPQQQAAQDDMQDVKADPSPPPSAPAGQQNGGGGGGFANGSPAAGAGTGGAGAGTGQNDALYIGDLQWVCTPVFFPLPFPLRSHVCSISETIRCMRARRARAPSFTVDD